MEKYLKETRSYYLMEEKEIEKDGLIITVRRIKDKDTKQRPLADRSYDRKYIVYLSPKEKDDAIKNATISIFIISDRSTGNVHSTASISCSPVSSNKMYGSFLPCNAIIRALAKSITPDIIESNSADVMLEHILSNMDLKPCKDSLEKIMNDVIKAMEEKSEYED